MIKNKDVTDIETKKAAEEAEKAARFEKAVLGSVLISTKREYQSDLLYRIGQIIQPEDFSRSTHKKIYSAMLDLDSKGELIDILTLTDQLDKKKQLEDAGGIAYITALPSEVFSAVNAERHASMVKDHAIKRDLINTARQIIENAYDTEDAEAAAGEAERNILAIRQKRESRQADMLEPMQRVLQSLEDIQKRCENGGKLSGVDTGLRDLNAVTGGLQASDLIVLAARPAMGKTALALSIAYNTAVKKKIPTLLFSLEMSSSQIDARLFSIGGLIESNNMRTGKISDKEQERLLEIGTKVSNSPLYIDDRAGQNIMQVVATARRLKREQNIQLMIVDYLQLIEGCKNKNRSREQEVSEISRQLKILARELNIPILALAQLSRATEQRQDKRPILSDLRDSGSIEQDADIVAFLHRQGYYQEKDSNGNDINPSITDLIIAKHRNGETKTIQLFFHLQFCKFDDMRL